MPVLITTQAEAEQRLEAPAEEALQLQKPAPDDAIVLHEKGSGLDRAQFALGN